MDKHSARSNSVAARVRQSETDRPHFSVPPPEEGPRLLLATITDAVLALLVGGLVVTYGTGYALIDPLFVPFFLLSAIMFSFVNHVIGMFILRASTAKLIFGLRVVRATDGRRPGWWRSIGRWLAGFAMAGVMAMAGDGDTVAEVYGLRTVRRRDRTHKRS